MNPTNTPETRACSSCVAFHASTNTCRHLSPAFGWPEVKPDDWCRRFENRDGPVRPKTKEPGPADLVRRPPPNITFADVRGMFPSKTEAPARMKELYRRAQQVVPIKSEGAFYSLLCQWVTEGHLQAVDSDGARGYRLAL